MKKFDKIHRIEKEFHDKWAETIKDSDVNYIKAFEAQTAVENHFALSQFGNISGKRILDLGCGMGDATIYFALKGANVNAVDISPGMIKVVKRIIKKKRLTKLVVAEVMLAENLKFKANYFDFVFGNGVLHHVDQNAALKEVYRVLKPKGIATFIEPLKHNPLVNIYRFIAKDVRTVTEHPLDYKKLGKFAGAKFTKITHHEFHLMTLLIFVWFFLVERISPNSERYWKKIIDDEKKVGKAFRVLNKVDQIVFKLIPFIKKFSWNTVLIYSK